MVLLKRLSAEARLPILLHSGVGEDFAHQIAAERLIKDKSGKLVWELLHRQNHLLDSTMAALGEFLHLPVWIDSPDRHFGLAIQTLHPGRLRTPADLQANPRIRRGVEIGDYGSPVAYWLAEPPDNRSLVGLTSANFRRVPRKIAHRWGCFHRRHANGPEQLRGETRLSPSMPPDVKTEILNETPGGK